MPGPNQLYQLPQQRRVTLALWRPAAAGFTILALVTSAATQALATAFSNDPALGHRVLSLGPYTLYQPWAIVDWTWRWSLLATGPAAQAFHTSEYILLAGYTVGFAVVYWMRNSAVRQLSSGTESVHGSAHWATAEHIQAAGLLPPSNRHRRASRPPEGVYVGAVRNPNTDEVLYLRHNGPEHILAFAPTRSGKGVGLVLPTLLSWEHSTVVLDIKGENYALTAGWRESIGQRCLRFDPSSSSESHCYNPLDAIRLGTEHEIADIQNIVTMIVDPDGKGLADHWAKTGSALLTGALLHVAYIAQNAGLPRPSLGDVADFLSDPTRTIEETFHVMLNGAHDPAMLRGWTRTETVEEDSDDPNPPAQQSPRFVTVRTPTHPVVAASARDMLNKAGNEASGVLSTALSFLTLYRDPIVRRNTASSDFTINDLVNAEAPTSLYLVVNPADSDRLKPLIRLLINQILRQLTREMKFADGASVKTYKHRLLLMFDEFTALGNLSIFQQSLAFMAGYGLKAYLIIQDLTQLYAAYTREESILSNCHIRIAYAPNKIETADLLSKMTGVQTVLKPSVTMSGDPTALGRRSVSQTLQEVSRPLLTPDELMRLPGPQKDAEGKIIKAGDMLIFAAGFPPVYGTQILYFLDPTFSARAKIPPPAVTHSPPRLSSADSVPPTPSAPEPWSTRLLKRFLSFCLGHAAP